MSGGCIEPLPRPRPLPAPRDRLPPGKERRFGICGAAIEKVHQLYVANGFSDVVVGYMLFGEQHEISIHFIWQPGHEAATNLFGLSLLSCEEAA